MNESLYVLPSARAIRQKQLAVEAETLFLPNYITMSDFIAKLTPVKGYRFLDEDTRTLLLLEASDFQHFSNLQIDRNFFTFTKNSSYIFKFFEELSAECYDIEKLKDADLYAEYEEHIAILQELYRRYEKLCNEKKLLDRIFLPKLYTFNNAYIQRYDRIEIFLEGYLTNFELELLEKATRFSEVVIQLHTTYFNRKMQKKMELLGFSLEPNYCYKLSLNEKKILSKERLLRTTAISCEALSESILQVAFVKQKIYEFIAKGYAPEKIAVVLPNENAAKALKSFDEKANLNFAMGSSFTETLFFQQLQATLLYLDDETHENRYRLARFGMDLYTILQEHYKKEIAVVDEVMELLGSLSVMIASKEVLKIYEEELYKLAKVLPFLGNMNLRSLLYLFMQRLSSRTLDDVRGGKITVMGVLETRSVVFDAVILIDFDEKSVPKRSNKDMFLNTKLRETAGLPTAYDRENLQKHYYERLIFNAKEVAISYISSADSTASRFLKELRIETEMRYSEESYASVLFGKSNRSAMHPKEIIEPYSFKDIALSNSRLKTFLSCKRQYYYRYVKNLQSHEIPRDIPQEHQIGTVVHKALERLYKKESSYSDVDSLYRDLSRELDAFRGESELQDYLLLMQKKLLYPFCKQEIRRFKEGWQVAAVEEYFEVPFYGMKLQGKIDRVDKRDDKLEVLDYKTGNYTLYNKNSFVDAKDFQLEFYYLLAGGMGSVERCGFYDLKEGKIVDELFFEEKMEILKAHIADLLQIEEVDFALCDDRKTCQFCPYAVMCGRD